MGIRKSTMILVATVLALFHWCEAHWAVSAVAITITSLALFYHGYVGGIRLRPRIIKRIRRRFEQMNGYLDGDRLDEKLAAAEQHWQPLLDSAAKSIRWASPEKQMTEFAVVSLHGFSATSEEMSPYPEEVAKALGANLFRQRMSGHGLARGNVPGHDSGAALRQHGTAERWLEDAVEAFAIAEQIGQRLVIIGCSTGGSLAYWLAAQPWALPKIDVIVLVSPAFALHPLAGYDKLKHAVHWCPRLLRPLLLRWALGMSEREIDCSKFPEMIKYWTTKYPVAALEGIFDLYWTNEREVDPTKIVCALQVIASRQDTVASFAATEQIIAQMRNAVVKQVVDFSHSTAMHNVVGRVCSPATTPEAVEATTKFVSNFSLGS